MFALVNHGSIYCKEKVQKYPRLVLFIFNDFLVVLVLNTYYSDT